MIFKKNALAFTYLSPPSETKKGVTIFTASTVRAADCWLSAQLRGTYVLGRVQRSERST